MKYWINVVSQDHVNDGFKGSFMQACHGKSSPLKRMKAGDYVIFYSPKKEFSGNEKCQSFTAIGKVKDDEIYQVEMREDFVPYRRNISFFDCRQVPVNSLIDELNFIKNKKNWGFVFRFGFFEIIEQDFKLISEKMLENSEILLAK